MAKKWKGKDWYSILAPKMFGENLLSETPTTDPKNLTGRNIEVSVPQLTGDRSKHHMKLKFKAFDIKDKNIHTQFNGYSCNREFISRTIRKRSQKLDATDYIETKDNWKLQVTTTVILNRNVDANIQTKTRNFLADFLKESAGSANIDEFVKAVISSVYQKKMRKEGSKIYPIRFSEIAKIEVIKAGAG